MGAFLKKHNFLMEKAFLQGVRAKQVYMLIYLYTLTPFLLSPLIYIEQEE